MIRLLLALTLIFPFLYKYSFVITNQFSQLPIILSFTDPGYLKYDWYTNVNREFGPRTIFAWYMAQTTKIIPLSISYFLHYLLCIFLTFYASYRLSYLIFKDKFIAIITSICILFGTSITLGGNILVTADLSAPQLPLSVTLLAIVFLIEKRYLYSSALFALASYFHPLIGIEATGVFFASLFAANIFKKEPVVPFLKKAVIPYLILFSPGFYLYFSEATSSSIPSLTKIKILAYMRNSHHFVLSSWPLNHFLRFAILLFFLVIMVILLKQLKKRKVPETLSFSTIFILLLCLLAYICTEVIFFYPVVLLQLFRLTVYIYWIGTVIIFGDLLFFYLSAKSRWRFLLLIPLFLSNEQILYPEGKIYLLAVILASTLILFFSKIPKKILILLLLIYFSLFRYHNRLNIFSYIYYPTDETNIALWSKDNLPSDAVILVPPEYEKFRLIANRAVVADWKSFPFQEKAMMDWAQRMSEIGNIDDGDFKNISLDRIAKGYRRLTSEEIITLSKKYSFKYVITDQKLAGFRILYDQSIKLYGID